MEKWGAKDMELILGLLCERRKIRVEWKQIACAVILALFAGGMYHYVSVQAKYIAEDEGKGVVSVCSYDVFANYLPNIQEKLPILIDVPGNFGAADSGADTDTDTGSHAELFAESGAEDIGLAGKETDTGGRERISKQKRERAAFTKTDASAEQGFLPSDTIADIKVSEKSGESIEWADMAEEITKIPEPVIKKEISGFVCDMQGCIVGIANPSKFMKDSLVVLPRNSACTGIKRNSFKGIEEKIAEVFIPANIIYIEQGVFDDLPNLVYIEAQQGNAEYYSVNGVLYYSDGKVAACPNRQRNQ